MQVKGRSYEMDQTKIKSSAENVEEVAICQTQPWFKPQTGYVSSIPSFSVQPAAKQVIWNSTF